MSGAYEYEYELEREMKRRIAEERVSRKTEEFYERYLSQYEELVRNGAESLIPEEMEQLSSDLRQIRSLLVSDPFGAREISQGVGRYIYSLHGLSRAAQEQFDRAMRMKSEEKRLKEETQRNQALSEYYIELQSIAPAVVNFGIDSFQNLKNDILSGKVKKKEEIRSKISHIKGEAKIKADEWKRNAKEKGQAASAEKRLKDAEEVIKKEKWEDKEKANHFVTRLAKMREDLVAGKALPFDIFSAADSIEASVDDEKISEEVRRETVVAIVKQLRSQDFIVSKPQIVSNEGGSFVKITAQQPSGRRAGCIIDLKGKIKYRFDNYEGMACVKDIEKFNADLEKIYSIKLSDERVLWQNPDRLMREQDSTPAGNGERRHL